MPNRGFSKTWREFLHLSTPANVVAAFYALRLTVINHVTSGEACRPSGHSSSRQWAPPLSSGSLSKVARGIVWSKMQGKALERAGGAVFGLELLIQSPRNGGSLMRQVESRRAQVGF